MFITIVYSIYNNAATGEYYRKIIFTMDDFHDAVVLIMA